MRGNFTSALCGMIAASVLAAPIEVQAAPPSAPNQAGLRLPELTADVYYRRYYRRYPYRYGYRRGYGYAYDPSGAIFGAAAVGMVAAGVAAATAPRYYYGYPGWGW